MVGALGDAYDRDEPMTADAIAHVLGISRPTLSAVCERDAGRAFPDFRADFLANLPDRAVALRDAGPMVELKVMVHAQAAQRVRALARDARCSPAVIAGRLLERSFLEGSPR